MGDFRRHPRFPANFGSTFSGGHFAGQGVITNLSVGGCSIESKTVLAVKSGFALHIQLPDSPWPLQIERAVVRWARGNTYGVQFERLSRADTNRLHQLIQDLEQGPLVVMQRAKPLPD
jgi:hypothetical protein